MEELSSSFPVLSVPTAPSPLVFLETTETNGCLYFTALLRTVQ